MAKSLVLIEAAESLCDLRTREGELQVAYLYNARGILSLQHQQLVDARYWFERTYAIRQKYLEEHDPNTVAVVGNLALTLLGERRWTDLISFNESRRQNFEGQSQHNIPTRLSFGIYNLLALAYLELNNPEQAWNNMVIATEMIDRDTPVYSQLNG